jgi:hypothetical protein
MKHDNKTQRQGKARRNKYHQKRPRQEKKEHLDPEQARLFRYTVLNTRHRARDVSPMPISIPTIVTKGREEELSTVLKVLVRVSNPSVDG